MIKTGSISSPITSSFGSSINVGNIAANWTLVFLPDTQAFIQYSKVSRFQDQIDWVVANQEAENIRHVAHVGDIIHSYSEVGVSEPHWVSAEGVMDDLETADIPYSVTTGNHDMPTDGRDTTMMNSYFPLSKFQAFDTYGGAAEANKCENTYHTFREGSIDWLILSIEFGPRDSIVTWANSIITANPNHKVIIITHGYLSKDGDRLSTGQSHSPDNGYGLGADVNNGDDLWTNLVKLHSNILLVLCGHDGQASPLIVASRLDSTGDNGNEVFQLMHNYQYGLTNNSRMMILRFSQEDYVTVDIDAYNATTDDVSTDPDESFTISEGPLVTISSPEDGGFTNQDPVTVAWEVDGVSQVTELTEDLTEGANTITRSSTDAQGRVGRVSIDVTLDTVAPVVVITSPEEDDVLVSSPADVAWTVDGVAQVTELTESLTEGANAIVRNSTDAAGNVGSDTVNVTYNPPAPWAPGDDTGLYAWYDPNNTDNTTESGGLVSNQASEIGTGLDIDGGTPLNTGSLNSKIIFNYDGTDDTLGRDGAYNETTNPYIADGSFQIIMLFRVDSDGVSATTDGILRVDNSLGFSILSDHASQFLGRINAYGIGFSSTDFTQTTNYADDAYHLMRIVFDSSGSTAKVWIDGTLEVSLGTYNGAIQTTELQTFMGRNAGTFVGGGHGDIFFTNTLTDAIYTEYKTWINTKYATSF